MKEKTDVLVIGGGIAGLMAALSAHQNNAKVALVSKHPIGRSGNTLVSGGGIAGATNQGDNTSEVFLEDVLRSGKGLAKPELASMLARRSPEMLERLLEFGVKLLREGEGFKLRKPPGHQVARNIPTNWEGLSYLNRGLSFTLPLVESCYKKGIDMQDGWEAISLIRSEGRVGGAIFQNKQGEIKTVYATQVILATGGAGGLFARTNNTADIQGRGLALALEAGCSLQDMEQIQFYPTMMFSPLKMTVSNPLFGLGAVLRNNTGERFMQNYDPKGDMATRDAMARAIFMEIEAGRGINGTVYFDCTGIPGEKLRSLFTDFCNFLSKKGLDPSVDYLCIAPCVHYTLGGIVINENCETEVEGLLCAGEICGGIHGANRLSGAALMEACVTGWQAGETAAENSRNIPKKPFEIADESISIRSALAGETLIKIQELLWEKSSLIRTKEGLNDALQTVLTLREQFQEDCPAVLLIAEAIIKSALFREESRGAHYRSDFPETQSNFSGNVICRLNSGGLEVHLSQTDD